jgi:methyl-accepting chemotaxis protein
LGFGLLVVLAAGLGGLAMYNMTSVSTSMGTLNDQFVPEANIAGRLGVNVGSVTTNGKAYGLTGDKKFLAAARDALKSVADNLKEADTLAERFPGLVKLREQLGAAHQSYGEYTRLLDETEKQNAAMEQARATMNATAAEAVKQLEDLQQRQATAQAKEIADGADRAALEDRRLKVEYAAEIRNATNRVRINAWKAQASDDVAIFGQADKDFTEIDALAGKMNALLRREEDKKELADVVACVKRYATAMEALRTGMTDLKALSVKRGEAMAKLDETASELMKAAFARTSEVAQETMTAMSTAVKVIGIGLAVTAVLGVASATLITRSITRPVNRIVSTLSAGAEQTASASAQVSAASQSLAQGASEQAASLEETSSSLEEMASMTRKNADTAQQAAGLAGEAKTAASQGNDSMKRMSSAIVEIQRSATETAKIIKVIDEIAFQTNLLALNAAVEAARAGEAGKGFAVVAEEVRNLAMRSAEAAKNTAGMIEGSVQAARNGVTLSEEVGKSLTEITGAADRVNALIGEIAAASREQSTGIEQVNQAVAQMDKVTQQNAANAEESAAASEEMSSQAEQLRSCVMELQALVGGAKGAAADTSHQWTRPGAGQGGHATRPAPAAHKSVSPKAAGSRDSIPLPSSENPADAKHFAEFSKAA